MNTSKILVKINATEMSFRIETSEQTSVRQTLELMFANILKRGNIIHLI